MITDEARRSLESLRQWVERAGWAGYDPFDVRAHPLYLRLTRRARSGRWRDRALLDLVYRLEQRFPRGARVITRTRPSINAKGMGLFARGYLLLARSGDPRAREEADRRIAWLLDHPSPFGVGVSWGYPFDWESQCRLPAGTPSAVVTAAVGDALRLRAALSGPETDAAHLAAVGEFLSRGLRRLEGPDGSLCFSYTPLDAMHVHNANLIAAEFLLWAGARFQRHDWQRLAERAFRYTLRDQEPSGAWDYWGPPDRGRRARTVDPYHTGFVLRMLLRAHAIAARDEVLQAAERGYNYFVRALFDGPRPRATDTRPHPVNIHSVAEALLTFLAFRHLDPRAEARALALLSWAREILQDRQGFFYTLWSPRRVSRLPMMRWGQGWMFLALSAWLAAEERP